MSEILGGTNIFVNANVLGLFGMAGQYNQAEKVCEKVRPYKLVGRLQPVTQQLHKEETSSSEKSTSKGREESATVNFAGLKQ
jgi:hypothetical protein